MAAWKLPLIVAALALPTAAGFLIGGPGLGLAVGILAALALAVVAVRQRPRPPIETEPHEGRQVLIVVTCAVESQSDVDRIATAAGLTDGGGEKLDVMLLAPTRIGFLDRWATDVEASRQAAQESLVVTVAELAKAGIAAESRIGDEDVVQAVEDQLRSFPADEVVLVTGDEREVGGSQSAADELRSRLRAEFRHLELGAPQV